MKNTPTPTQIRWGQDLRSFDGALRARGMAERTRRAYALDLGQLADWSHRHDLGPRDLEPRTLRRFAGVLSERGMSRSTIARKLASIRSFYRHLFERGEIDASPADLVATPKRDQYLPRVLRPDEVSGLLDSIPTGEPLKLRDRAMFELAYAAGLRAEEIVNLDVTDLDPDAEEIRVPLPLPRAPAARRPRACGRARRPCTFSFAPGPQAVHLGRSPAAADVRGRGHGQRRHIAAHPAPFVCDPPARGWCRSPHDPGAPGARQHQHDSDVHSDRVGTAPQGVRKGASSRVDSDRWHSRPT